MSEPNKKKENANDIEVADVVAQAQAEQRKEQKNKTAVICRKPEDKDLEARMAEYWDLFKSVIVKILLDATVILLAYDKLMDVWLGVAVVLISTGLLCFKVGKVSGRFERG